MKKIILSTILIVFTITTSIGQSIKDESFGVRGNCGMCKKRIEKTVKSVDGVTKAIWDKKNKKIDVSFDSSKTNLNSIHQAIANIGYDTDKIKGVEKAYNNLPSCCQYDRKMKMGSISKKKIKACCGGKNKSNKKSCH